MKILDEDFITKNEDKAKIIYKNKIYELKEYFEDIDANYNNKELIKFKLKFFHNIINMSFMLYNCDSLISLSSKNLYSNSLPSLEYIMLNNQSCEINDKSNTKLNYSNMSNISNSNNSSNFYKEHNLSL